MKPITPVEAAAGLHVPDFVVAVVNRLIAEAFDGRAAVLKQDTVIAGILATGPSVKRHGIGTVKADRADVFNRGWLNFEGLYEEAGWSVEYDKPAYNETYAAVFRFTRRSS